MRRSDHQIRDATITGSRKGHASIFLWYILNKKGYRGIRKEVQKCLRNAHYLAHHLREAGISETVEQHGGLREAKR